MGIPQKFFLFTRNLYWSAYTVPGTVRNAFTCVNSLNPHQHVGSRVEDLRLPELTSQLESWLETSKNLYWGSNTAPPPSAPFWCGLPGVGWDQGE